MVINNLNLRKKDPSEDITMLLPKKILVQEKDKMTETEAPDKIDLKEETDLKEVVEEADPSEEEEALN